MVNPGQTDARSGMAAILGQRSWSRYLYIILCCISILLCEMLRNHIVNAPVLKLIRKRAEYNQRWRKIQNPMLAQRCHAAEPMVIGVKQIVIWLNSMLITWFQIGNKNDFMYLDCPVFIKPIHLLLYPIACMPPITISLCYFVSCSIQILMNASVTHAEMVEHV